MSQCGRVRQPASRYEDALEPPHPQDVPAALARATMLAMQPPRRPVLASLPMDDWAATAQVEAGRRRLLEVPIDEAGATHWCRVPPPVAGHEEEVAMVDAQSGPESGGRPGRRAEPSGKPLVYSCSGCSSAAQMANALAVRLDRHGAAEMSCIAGLGGDVGSLVRLARSGRPILALDGCALVCVEATLRRHGLTPDAHIVLSRFGVRKRRHTDYDEQEANDLFEVVVDAASGLAAGAP